MLNLPRCWRRFSGSVEDGVKVALGAEPPLDWYEAVAADEEEARDMAFEARVRRKEAKLAAKLGF